MQAFSLIRVRNLSSNEIRSAEIHNARLYKELGLKVPDHINIGQTDNNSSYILKKDAEPDIPFKEAIYNKIKDAEITVRKNAVVALEYVLSASPDFFKAYSASGHFSNCVKWLAEKHGYKNIVSVSEHYDESNPHAHIIVVPIIEKEIKWKNSKGEGKKKENRLCARDFTGDKHKLRQLQQDYFEFCSDYGSRYNVKFIRGMKAEEQIKHYLKRTSPEIEKRKNELSELNKQLEFFKLELKNCDLLLAQKRRDEIKRDEKIVSVKLAEQNKNLENQIQEIAKKEKEKESWEKINQRRDFGLGM